jgi:hypothetical protein
LASMQHARPAEALLGDSCWLRDHYWEHCDPVCRPCPVRHFMSTCVDLRLLQACCGTKFHCMWHSSPYHWRRPDCNYFHFSPDANVTQQAMRACWDRGTCPVEYFATEIRSTVPVLPTVRYSDACSGMQATLTA